MVNTQAIPASASAQDSIFRDFTQISTDSPQTRWLTVYYGMYRVGGPDGLSAGKALSYLAGCTYAG
jgi:hypothetical protein